MQKGDKVKQRGRNRYGILGNYDEPLWFVKWYEEDGRSIVACGWFHQDLIELVPPELRVTSFNAPHKPEVNIQEYIELLNSIDSALDNRNESLFMELTTKLKEFIG